MGRVRVAALASLLMVFPPASAQAAFFGQPAVYPATAGSSSSEQVASGDFNLDNKPDLALVNTGNPGKVTILLGDGAGGFTQPAGSPYSVGQEPRSIVVGDFNNDGKPDFVAANFIGGSLSVLLGDGSGAFTEAPGSPVSAPGGPLYVASGDFDHDGRADLATANISPAGVGIYIGTGNGGFAAAPGSPYPTGGTLPQGLAVGDLNADGRLDIAVANHMSSTISVLLGSGSNGTVGFLQAVGSPFAAGANGPASVAIGDVNGDGRPDLATANDSSSTSSVFLGNGVGRFTPLTGSPFTSATGPLGVAVGDLNGDGFDDVALADRDTGGVNGGALAVLLSTGTGLAAGPTVSVSKPVSVVMSDLDSDGRLDLAAANFLSPGGASVVLSTAAAVSSPSPGALTFADQPASTISEQRAVTMSNTGGDIALKVASVKIVGANADDFIKTTDTCDQARVAPNGSCTVDVRFAPTATGGRSAALRIADNSAGSPHDVTLSGNGVAAPTTGPGPAGQNGADGAQGPAGMTGATGATGPRGARGPRGRDAKVTCKLRPKAKKRKKRVVCTVRFAAPARSRAVARLTRHGRVYASADITVRRRTDSALRLNPRRAMPAGNYRLTLTVIDRGTTIRTVRFVTLG
jgi:hypothetical protein